MHNKKLATVAAMIIGLTVLATPAQAQLTGLVMKILRPVLEGAVKGMGVPEPAPFVDSAIAFIEGKPGNATVSFIAGLVNNKITDPVMATKIVNGIAGASAAAGAALFVSGDRDTGKKLASFAYFMINNPTFSSWREAVAAGNDVRIENGQMVVVTKDAPAAVAAVPPPREEYVQTRSDEVSPNLNIKHGRPGAEVLIDDKVVEVSRYEEYMFSGLPAGKHLITIRTPEEEGAMFVFVNPGRKVQAGYDDIVIELKRASVPLEVDPGIAGCAVMVDGVKIGETPLKTQIFAGRHELSIESEWAPPTRVTVEAKTGQALKLSPAITARGALVLSGPLPEEASVLVNGKTVENARQRLYLEPGQYTVEVRGATVRPYRASVLVERAGLTEHALQLTFITGAVTVTGIPPMVAVYFDGAEQAQPKDGTLVVDNAVIGEHVVGFLSSFSETPEVVMLTVREGASTRVPVPVGHIVLPALPPGTRVSVNGKPLAEELAIEGIPFPLLPGEYRLAFEGTYLPRVETTAVCKAGETVSPELDLPRLGLLAAVFGGAGDIKYSIVGTGERKDVRSANGGFSELLPPGDYELLAWNADDIATGLKRMFMIEPWKQTDLSTSLPYSREFLLAQAESQLYPIEQKFKVQRRWRGTGLMTLLVGGGVSVAGSIGSYILGIQAYDGYASALNEADARDYRQKVDTFTTGLNVSMVAGITSAAASGLFYMLGRTKESNIREADDLRRQIEALSAGEW